eukprot:391543-Rhodomonas_salina.1
MLPAKASCSLEFSRIVSAWYQHASTRFCSEQNLDIMLSLHYIANPAWHSSVLSDRTWRGMRTSRGECIGHWAVSNGHLIAHAY